MSKYSKGFTLLEAIVALAIFAAGTVTLYAWYSTVLLGLIKAEERLVVTEFSRNVEAHLVTLNLRQAANGEYRANDYIARWNATLVEPKKQGKNLSGFQSYYELGLYDVDVRIIRLADSQEIERFSTRLVGYEGVRVPKVGF